MGRNALAEIAYVGSQSHRLPVRWNEDECSTSGSLTCNASAIPWPQYSYVYFASDRASANYNAFTARFQREFFGDFKVSRVPTQRYCRFTNRPAEGFTMSDFIFGIRAGRKAIEAGMDLEIPIALEYQQKLAEAVQKGELAESVVDR